MKPKSKSTASASARCPASSSRFASAVAFVLGQAIRPSLRRPGRSRKTLAYQFNYDFGYSLRLRVVFTIGDELIGVEVLVVGSIGPDPIDRSV